jgi:hypothetical protein
MDKLQIENKEIKRNSTVAISPDDTKKLDRFCKANGITKKDFIPLALGYFLANGINPAKHETPVAEVAKINKRLDQVFAFIKTQEKEFLRPMVETTSFMQQKISSDLSRLEKIGNDMDTLRQESEDFKVKTVDTLRMTYGKIKELNETNGKKIDDLCLIVENKLSKKMF